MPATYRIQRGTLGGSYKTCYSTESEKAAWVAYCKTRITTGEKKRLQERVGKTGAWRKIKDAKEYWT